MHKKQIIAALLVAVALGASGWYFFSKKNGGGMHGMGDFPTQVEAVTATPRAVATDIQAVGTLRAAEAVTIRPEVPGRIVKISFTEGSKVKKGDLLFKVDDSIYAADVAKNEASLNLARVTAGRLVSLRKKGVGSEQSSDEAVARLREAEADVELSRRKLAKTDIAAPFDGTVGLRSVSEGQYVEAGKDLASFQASGPRKAEFSLPEKYLAQVKPGQEAAIQVNSYPGRKFKAKIYAVDSKVDENTRNFSVVAESEEGEEELRPGMFVNVVISGVKREGVIVIPESAVVTTGSGQSVFLAVDGKAKFTPVQTGERKNGEVEITSGISPGDVVITSGQIKLHEGSKVKIDGGKPAP